MKDARGNPLHWCAQCEAFHYRPKDNEPFCKCELKIRQLEAKVSELRGRLADMATIRERGVSENTKRSALERIR